MHLFPAMKQEVKCQSVLTPPPPQEVTAPCWRFCEVILCNGYKPHLVHLNMCKQEIFFYRASAVSFHTFYFFENDVCVTRFVVSAKNITVLDEAS